MLWHLPSGKHPSAKTDTSDHFPCPIYSPPNVPPGKPMYEKKTSFPEAGAPATLAKKIPTPSQYSSKWPLAVGADAGVSKGGTNNTMRARKTYAAAKPILPRLCMSHDNWRMIGLTSHLHSSTNRHRRVAHPFALGLLTALLLWGAPSFRVLCERVGSADLNSSGTRNTNTMSPLRYPSSMVNLISFISLISVMTMA